MSVKLPINLNPNLKNYTHNAYLDAIISSNIYNDGMVVHFKSDRDFEVDLANVRLEREGKEYKIYADSGFEPMKAFMFQKVTETEFYDEIIIYSQCSFWAWSGFNVLLSDHFDKNYDRNEETVIKLGHPSENKMFVKYNKVIKEYLQHIDGKIIQSK